MDWAVFHFKVCYTAAHFCRYMEAIAMCYTSQGRPITQVQWWEINPQKCNRPFSFPISKDGMIFFPPLLRGGCDTLDTLCGSIQWDEEVSKAAWGSTRIRQTRYMLAGLRAVTGTLTIVPVLSGPSSSSCCITGTLANASNSKWLGFQKGMDESWKMRAPPCHSRKVFQGLLISVWVTPRDPGRCPHKGAASSHFGCEHRLCWELEFFLQLQSPWST